jgi:hypothetical protein
LDGWGHVLYYQLALGTFDGNLDKSEDIEDDDQGENDVQLPSPIDRTVREGKEVDQIILIGTLGASYVAFVGRLREEEFVATFRKHLL